MKSHRIVILVAALGAAIFVLSGLIQAADTSFPVYFADSKLIVKANVTNSSLYLPIKELVTHLGLPYTDSLALETLTIRSGSNQLVVTKNSALISYNGQIILLPNQILREDNRWLAPVEFLTMGLSKMTGSEFRYRPGAPRIFVGNVDPPELEMNAQTLGQITRLTLRCAVPINLEVKRDDPTKAILSINVNPVDPARERLDHRDALLRTVSFDDSDGQSKLVLDINRDVAELRVTPANNNRIFFVDLLRAGAAITAVPPPPVDPGTATPVKPDAPANRRVRVVVIDPGHGGMDTGVATTATNEKDLTLALARRLRTVLQMRLGATVLLTRDSDVALDNEARSAVANNNQANLFISLHIGYSVNKTDATSAIFVMKESFGDTGAQAAKDQLFLPWYLGYRIHRAGSTTAATILQEELTKGIPGWKFPVRTAPLAVLSSAAMPSLLFEIGNLNNSVNAQTLTDVGFQTKLVNAIADAVQRFSEKPQAAAN